MSTKTKSGTDTLDDKTLLYLFDKVYTACNAV